MLERALVDLRAQLASHGGQHEYSGGDTVRLGIRSAGTQLNKQRSINVLAPLTAVEDSANKEIELDLDTSSFIMDADLNAKGDLISASAADTPAIVTVGANDTILMADSAQTAGLKWVAAATPGNVTPGTAAAEGTSDDFSRGSHVHGWGGMSPITNSISGNVALNNTANYFDGPSVAQGSSGTWWASGNVGVEDTAGAATIVAKLWDGTTMIDEALINLAAGQVDSIHLSGYLASPAGNLRISVRDSSSTSGIIRQGNKESTISAIRIA